MLDLEIWGYFVAVRLSSSVASRGFIEALVCEGSTTFRSHQLNFPVFVLGEFQMGRQKKKQVAQQSVVRGAMQVLGGMANSVRNSR